MDYSAFSKKLNTFSSGVDVSRETFEKLSLYISILLETNKSLNLVSKGTGQDIWDRHLLDSLQLCPLFSLGERVCDFGSGGGFPGIVLSIMGFRPLLVESRKKKADFLRYVSRETCVENKVICGRVESLSESFDVVTARAVASLKKLLSLSFHLATPETRFVFPKGRLYKEEIQEARMFFDFDVDLVPSQICDEGRILVIRSCRKK